jgi:hypothetical protein
MYRQPTCGRICYEMNRSRWLTHLTYLFLCCENILRFVTVLMVPCGFQVAALATMFVPGTKKNAGGKDWKAEKWMPATSAGHLGDFLLEFHPIIFTNISLERSWEKNFLHHLLLAPALRRGKEDGFGQAVPVEGKGRYICLGQPIRSSLKVCDGS